MNSIIGASESAASAGIVERKAAHSRTKLDDLSRQLAECAEAKAIPGLAIYATGSYARLEASEHSDLDLFFAVGAASGAPAVARTQELRLFGKLIEIAERMEFPPFSDDGRFLCILDGRELLNRLGGREDDYGNYFTARMLMLLESRPVFGGDRHWENVRSVVRSYLRDFKDHKEDFKPTFLMNDIVRFWKTLCLNYEHRRNQPPENEEKRVLQKIKNFKLKYSRMMTCFATICAILHDAISFESEPWNAEDRIMDIVLPPPKERLSGIPNDTVKSLLAEYEWFLEQTDVPVEDLKANFGRKGFRSAAFRRADKFGDTMYELLKGICRNGSGDRYLRYLLV